MGLINSQLLDRNDCDERGKKNIQPLEPESRCWIFSSILLLDKQYGRRSLDVSMDMLHMM